MIKIDLVTGFLGSGKTTFIKKYAQYLMDKGLNIGVLENDYGAVNVDMMLLGELDDDKCEIEMISGGCDHETHKRRFKTKLIAMGMCGYDRVIVEPSGIYDVDEFFDTLREEPLEGWYEIGNVIAVADASGSCDMSDNAEYLLASESASAGMLVLSHADSAENGEVESMLSYLNDTLDKIGCGKEFELGKDAEAVSLPDISDDVLDKIYVSGYRLCNYTKCHLYDEAFMTLYYMNTGLDKDGLCDIIKQLFEKPEYGNVMRVKGFAGEADDGWYSVNANCNGIETQKISVGQDVVIVIGEHLEKEKIEKLLK